MKDEETLEYSTEFLDYFSKKNFPTKTTQENFDDLIQDSDFDLLFIMKEVYLNDEVKK